ncbi:MAG: hypothetical protein WC242_02460 [Candidatus Paceibacterota bacterium]|jgi:HD-GYP domain-containing protein (c-di-GMP phosphodiesterase class II)
MNLEQESISPEQSQEKKEPIFDQEKFRSLCAIWKEEETKMHSCMKASFIKGAKEHEGKAKEAYDQLLEIAEAALKESNGDRKIFNEITRAILKIESYGGGSETIDLTDFLEDLVLKIVSERSE